MQIISEIWVFISHLMHALYNYLGCSVMILGFLWRFKHIIDQQQKPFSSAGTTRWMTTVQCQLHRNNAHHCKGLAGKMTRHLSLATKHKQRASLKSCLSSCLRFSISSLYPLLVLSVPTAFPKLFQLWWQDAGEIIIKGLLSWD